MNTKNGLEKKGFKSLTSKGGSFRLGIIFLLLLTTSLLVRCVPISVYAAGSREESGGRGSRPNNPDCKIGWRWINKQLTITHVSWQHMDGLQVGDVVLSINGTPTSQAVLEAEEEFSHISDTTERLERALEHLLTANRTYLSLLVQNDSEPAYWYTITNVCIP